MGFLSIGGLIFLSSGCVTHTFETPQHSTAPKLPPTAVNFREVGLASWYGPGFYNHKTASGEKFKKQELTCAHRSLPFGTHIQVTNLSNDRSVEVRVNDRGPFIRNKIIDLSYAAAKQIGMFPGGSARVGIALLTNVPEAGSNDGESSRSPTETPAVSASNVPNAHDSTSIVDLIKKAQSK